MRIIVADEQSMFRDLIANFCGTHLGIDVVGTSQNGEEAIQLVAEHQPDAALVDIKLPDLSGFDVAERLKKSAPGVKVLLMSSCTSDYILFRVKRSCADGFVNKGAHSIRNLQEAFDAVRTGKKYYGCPKTESHPKAGSALERIKLLSPTEQRILGFIGDGYYDEEIGVEMNISRATAQTHRRNISHKLRVHGTPKLITFAHRHGFTSKP